MPLRQLSRKLGSDQFGAVVGYRVAKEKGTRVGAIVGNTLGGVVGGYVGSLFDDPAAGNLNYGDN